MLLVFYLIKCLQLIMVPHPRLVFLLQGQMTGNPHKVVHTPAFQRNLIQLKQEKTKKKRKGKDEQTKNRNLVNSYIHRGLHECFYSYNLTTRRRSSKRIKDSYLTNIGF
jgi:hypothetical protein